MLVSNADDVKKAMDAVYIGHARDQYRVSCYTAFCINCAEDPSLTNFRLATAFSFGINDNDKTPETIARLKRMVRDWVIAASFLSMIEIMSSYLDNVFALLSFLRAGYSDKKTEIGTEQKFERKSVNDKLSYLRKEFGFDPQHGEVVRTMTNVRNVIVHNAGWVHNKHCNNKDKNQLVLRWKGLKLEKPVEGVLVEVPHEHRGPAAGPGEMIRWEVVIKEKTFKVGQQIEISPYEIGDIGWSVSEVMQDIKTKVHKEAEKAAAMGKKLGKLKLVIDGPADR